MLQSCIVADPPAYRDPVATRPVLDAYHAAPSNLQLIVADKKSTSPINFTVGVRSEDGGDPLIAIFWLDYNSEGQDFVDRLTVPASTFDDTGRTVRYAWRDSGKVDAGCHLMTLVVAHFSSYQQQEGNRLDPQKADTDAAIINWWVNVLPQEGGSQNTLVNCPTPEAPAP